MRAAYDFSFSRARSGPLSLYARRRPWRELLAHPSSYTRPISLPDFTSRVKRNLTYFRVNYTMIILIILFLSLLWHPISLIVYLIVFIAWFFLYFHRDEPLMVFNRMIDDRVVMVGLGVVTVVSLVLTSVWLNVLVSVLVGIVLVGLHAMFRITEDLFLEEDDFDGGGLHSFVATSV
ncbi:PRA1 family protein F3-like [Lycium ferocissimum]|uniref:PRA1 family protein F3-like n=1 Tax=Lycium ferocissimum TaxID=112874 RepID=UPI002815DAE0|nr:PRA1 family protein F3-like [Lycium ferocissimum]